MGLRIIRWLGFGVVFPLATVVVAYGKLAIFGPATTMPEFISRGGLLILAVGISAAGVGDLLAIGERYPKSRFAAGAGIVIVLFASATFYVVASDTYTESLTTQTSPEQSPHIGPVATLSVALYVGAVAVAGACALLAGLAERAERERVT